VITTLRTVLQSPADLPWDHALYLPLKESWSLDTECAVLDPDDVQDDRVEAPQKALLRGLEYALDVGTVREIVNNVSMQRRGADLGLRLEALKHYYRNDAFITLKD
jgi:hypothetical protein